MYSNHKLKSTKTVPRLPKTPSKTKLNTKDPVKVYCRLRPMQNDTDVSCMKVLSSDTVYLSPPENAVNYKSGYKGIKYSFKQVFPESALQNEVFGQVALPLVENLVRGKNGLLFTYGVTGSGKTFTMTGDANNMGIMPRCLDVIFKTISNYQAQKYIFKPDKMNMFEVHSEVEAMLERQQALLRLTRSKKNNSNPDLAFNSSELSKVGGIDEDNQYSVFVTYVEIYNNNVYDLLEEGNNQRSLQMKIIREDGNKNMYVHGVTEVEVKSPEEAFEQFYKGLKRKRMAHTTLNAESSRSHSVFTIRVVQAPVDELGERVVQDKNRVAISQLSLVDLAGSERTNRTNNTGQRLREAGNINNSLMTLRSCLEVLRENQLNGANKVVPYRDSKITHLFKNFFEGEGHVKMIVCVNPRKEDYDETVQVMRFAEVAQEVEVARPIVLELGNGMTPGRRKANRLFKEACDQLEALGRPEAQKLDIDLGLVYNLGPNFPSLELRSPEADYIIKELIAHLELRISKREHLVEDKTFREEKFRAQLVEFCQENLLIKNERDVLKTQLSQERKRSKILEGRLIESETLIDSLNRKLDSSREENQKLQNELDDARMTLNDRDMELDKQKRKFSQKIANTHEKMKNKMENIIKYEKEQHKNEKREKDEKIRLVTHILNSDTPTKMLMKSNIGSSAGDIAITSETGNRPPGPPLTDLTNRTTAVASVTQSTRRLIVGPSTANAPSLSKRGVAVANPRHRRSLSADGNGWVEHQPKRFVPLGTVMKPHLSKARPVTKLTNVKDIANSKTSKYCLIDQAQDTDGELETRLYKGDVVPTCGGGAQVIFNDIEMLKQMSPNRNSNEEIINTDSTNQNSQQDSGQTCPRHSARHKRRDTSSENALSHLSTPDSSCKKARV